MDRLYVNPVDRRSRKRRDRHYIIAEILNKTRGGKLKTHIMNRANLSYGQLKQYLSLLLETGLLEIIDNPTKNGIYKITEKGMEYLHYYYKIMSLLRNETDKDSNP